MSVKRRDSRNRVLRNGESQRKDGRYVFKYIDSNGKAQFVYSWKLEKQIMRPSGHGIHFPYEKKNSRFAGI